MFNVLISLNYVSVDTYCYGKVEVLLFRIGNAYSSAPDCTKVFRFVNGICIPSKQVSEMFGANSPMFMGKVK